MQNLRSDAGLVNTKCFKACKMSLSGRQIRAARGLLRWSAEELAKASKLGRVTISRAEGVDDRPPITEANQDAIQRAFESAGIEFIEENGGGAGVRMKERSK